MRPCSRSGCRRRWASWSGRRRRGCWRLSVEVGLGVLRELLEEEVDEVVGPKGRWNPERTAVRHGHEDGEVTLGGRRVAVKRPRVADGGRRGEVPLETYEHFADRDQLGRRRAGADARRRLDPQVPARAGAGRRARSRRERSTSKSAVSRDVRAAHPRACCGS